MEVDLTTYNTLDEADRDIIYCYDWEVSRNENKRPIKLIDKNMLQVYFLNTRRN